MCSIRCAQSRAISATPSKRSVRNRKTLFVTRVLAAASDRHLKVPTNWITQTLNGCRAISGDTAIRLAHFFVTSAQFFDETAGPL
jgi:hypothetical protein